jgi:hypothetical protein
MDLYNIDGLPSLHCNEASFLVFGLREFAPDYFLAKTQSVVGKFAVFDF